MSTAVRKFIAFLVMLACLVLFVLGSFLPLRKSQSYIHAYSRLSQVKSLDDFNNAFNPVLDLYSPVGQPELVSAYLGIIIDVLNQKPGPKKEIADILIKNAEAKAMPVLAGPPTFSFSQIILKIAIVNKLGAEMYHDQSYYKRAEELLRMGLVYSPNRQAFLYNALDLYLYGNDPNNTRETAQRIIRYWPSDTRVQQILDFLNSSAGDKK